MDLPIAAHNIEVRIKTIKKHVQYALDDMPYTSSTDKSIKTLEKLLDRMDNGTNDVNSVVPNRIAGDLSMKEELQYINSIRLTKTDYYH